MEQAFGGQVVTDGFEALYRDTQLLLAADGPREIERAWKSLDDNEQKIPDVVLTLVGLLLNLETWLWWKA